MTLITWLIVAYLFLDFSTRLLGSWPDGWPRITLVAQGVLLVFVLLLLLRAW